MPTANNAALHSAYVGLGANLGNAAATVHAAIEQLAALPLSRVTQQSSLYKTAPIEADGDDFVNAVVEISTDLDPFQLLGELQKIEQHFGRIRSYQNAPRTLDCDLLLFDQAIINTPTLTVPHPRMHQRAFVIIPLCEIAPGSTIPALGPVKAWLESVRVQSIQKLIK